jgi:hypothetical protein
MFQQVERFVFEAFTYNDHESVNVGRQPVDNFNRAQ